MIVILGSQEMIWDSIAEEGYLTEYLQSKYGYDELTNFKCIPIDDDITSDDIKVTLSHIFSHAKIKDDPITVYVVDDLAITHAMVMCVAYGKSSPLIKDILVANSDGDFRSVLEMETSLNLGVAQ